MKIKKKERKIKGNEKDRKGREIIKIKGKKIMKKLNGKKENKTKRKEKRKMD